MKIYGVIFRVWFLIFSLLLFQSCKTQKSISNDTIVEINFGSGGGFTGKFTEYDLRPDRSLTRVTSLPADTSMLYILPKDSYDEIYTKVMSSGLDTVLLDAPGNFYYYIHLKNETINNRITWGSASQEVPEQVKIIYNELMSLVHNHSSK